MNSFSFWLRAGAYYFPALRLQHQFRIRETDAEGEGLENNKKEYKVNW